MTAERTDGVLEQLRGFLLAGADGGRTDQELLARYLAARDEAAFAAIVHRHGPTVWGVCRRLLRRLPDAEDAFQATFLVLARRAAAIRKRGSLNSWLHGVACRIARRLCADAARREQRQVAESATNAVSPDAEVTWREVRAVLDEELDRLPEKYRAPLLLCYLEGLTQNEAAQRLGWRPGVLRGRLDRGRQRLRSRLIRRGLTLSAALFGAVLGSSRASAAPPLVAAAAVKAASPCTGPSCFPPHVVALAEGVLRAMFQAKLKMTAVVLAALFLGVLSVVWLSGPLPAQDQPATGGKPQPVLPTEGAGKPAPDKSELERRVADLEKKLLRLTEEVEDLRSQLKQKATPPADPAGEFKIFALKTASAKDVARALTELLNKDQPRRMAITFDEATNSVLVRARPQDLAQVEELILRLDALTNPTAERVPEAKVYSSRNLDADAVAKVLSDVFKDGKVRVTSMGRNNSILIYGTPAEIAAVEAVIKKLEAAPPAERKTP
jgi:RNA polymerase sigma factor (sigma-70 family)